MGNTTTHIPYTESVIEVLNGNAHWEEVFLKLPDSYTELSAVFTQQMFKALVQGDQLKPLLDSITLRIEGIIVRSRVTKTLSPDVCNHLNRLVFLLTKVMSQCYIPEIKSLIDNVLWQTKTEPLVLVDNANMMSYESNTFSTLGPWLVAKAEEKKENSVKDSISNNKVIDFQDSAKKVDENVKSNVFSNDSLDINISDLKSKEETMRCNLNSSNDTNISKKNKYSCKHTFNSDNTIINNDLYTYCSTEFGDLQKISMSYKILSLLNILLHTSGYTLKDDQSGSITYQSVEKQFLWTTGVLNEPLEYDKLGKYTYPLAINPIEMDDKRLLDNRANVLTCLTAIFTLQIYQDHHDACNNPFLDIYVSGACPLTANVFFNVLNTTMNFIPPTEAALSIFRNSANIELYTAKCASFLSIIVNYVPQFTKVLDNKSEELVSLNSITSSKSQQENDTNKEIDSQLSDSIIANISNIIPKTPNSSRGERIVFASSNFRGHESDTSMGSYHTASDSEDTEESITKSNIIDYNEAFKDDSIGISDNTNVINSGKKSKYSDLLARSDNTNTQTFGIPAWYEGKNNLLKNTPPSQTSIKTKQKKKLFSSINLYKNSPNSDISKDNKQVKSTAVTNNASIMNSFGTDSIGKSGVSEASFDIFKGDGSYSKESGKRKKKNILSFQSSYIGSNQPSKELLSSDDSSTSNIETKEKNMEMDSSKSIINKVCNSIGFQSEAENSTDDQDSEDKSTDKKALQKPMRAKVSHVEKYNITSKQKHSFTVPSRMPRSLSSRVSSFKCYEPQSYLNSPEANIVFPSTSKYNKRKSSQALITKKIKNSLPNNTKQDIGSTKVSHCTGRSSTLISNSKYIYSNDTITVSKELDDNSGNCSSNSWSQSCNLDSQRYTEIDDISDQNSNEVCQGEVLNNVFLEMFRNMGYFRKLLDNSLSEIENTGEKISYNNSNIQGSANQSILIHKDCIILPHHYTFNKLLNTTELVNFRPLYSHYPKTYAKLCPDLYTPTQIFYSNWDDNMYLASHFSRMFSATQYLNSRKSQQIPRHWKEMLLIYISILTISPLQRDILTTSIGSTIINSLIYLINYSIVSSDPNTAYLAAKGLLIATNIKIVCQKFCEPFLANSVPFTKATITRLYEDSNSDKVTVQWSNKYQSQLDATIQTLSILTKCSLYDSTVLDPLLCCICNLVPYISPLNERSQELLLESWSAILNNNLLPQRLASIVVITIGHLVSRQIKINSIFICNIIQNHKIINVLHTISGFIEALRNNHELTDALQKAKNLRLSSQVIERCLTSSDILISSNTDYAVIDAYKLLIKLKKELDQNVRDGYLNNVSDICRIKIIFKY